jgi:uncharacterized protein (TIGR00299 family) protein
MKVAYFDCPFGAGGDMLLGALLDAGLNTDQWLAELSKISLPYNSYKVIIEQVERCSLRVNKLKVLLPEHTHSAQHDHDHDVHPHQHEHSHDHHHTHSHPHSHSNKHTHIHAEHRNFKDIAALISNSKISSSAKNLAQKIFENLAKAEGFVHGIKADDIHFHEVGAIDSIIDIIGFAIAYEMLGIEKAVVSPLPLGSGTVETQHGLFPVPGPATLRLMHNAKAPISNMIIDFECLTPTAAAILTTIANDWSSPPSFKSIDATGYGAGTKNPTNFPNVCRVIIGAQNNISGKTNSTDIIHNNRFFCEKIASVEVILDDFSPQALSYAKEQLLNIGGLDTYVTPITAKKGRSGHLLTVLCKLEQLSEIEQYIFEHTSTLGMRIHVSDRLFLEREWQEVTLENSGIPSKIRIKTGKDTNGNVINIQPEYEDCIAYAKKTNIPLVEIFRLAIDKVK